MGETSTTTDGDFWTVTPESAFCVKFKDVSLASVRGISDQLYSALRCNRNSEPTTTKMFLNFCLCDQLPSPPDIDEEQLSVVIQSDNPDSFRIPMSLGELITADDNQSQPCLTADVLINRTYYQTKMRQSELFRAFTVVVACHLVENKHGIVLDQDHWTVLKNKKYMGGLVPAQNIRKEQRAVPLIQEITSVETDVVAKEPRLQMYNRRDADGRRRFYAQFRLDGVSDPSVIDLQMASQRMVLTVPPECYHSDVSLPTAIDCATVRSDFDPDSSTLHICADFCANTADT